MKRVFMIVLALLAILLIGNVAKAIEVIPVHGAYVQVLPPLGYRVVPYYVVPAPIPVTPQYVAPVIPPPVKPIFKTPIRDGLYYGLYYNRMWRYNRLGNVLGHPAISVEIQQQQQNKE